LKTFISCVRKTLFVLLISSSAGLVSKSWAVDLNVAQDAYGLGMGDAVAAIAGGTQSIPYNPAGIARVLVPMIQGGVGILPGPLDSRFSLGFLYPLTDGTVLGFSQYSQFPQGASSNTVYIGSFALPLDSTRDFLMGLNLKYLALGEEMSGAPIGGRGLGFDVGMSYDLRNPQGTLASFALVIQNVDTELRFDDNTEQILPRTFNLAASYQKFQDTLLEMDYLIYDQILESTSQSDRLRLGAERFFDEKNVSVRIGYDGLFNSDGLFTMGVGYHPAQPYEFDYAFQLPVNGSPMGHFLNFIYRFESSPASVQKAGPGQAVPTNVKGGASQADIDISQGTAAPTETPEEGQPVSNSPLRKLVIAVNPAAFSPAGRQKAVTITFPGDLSPDIRRWSLDIQDVDKKVERSFSGTGPLPPFLGWEGLDHDAHPVGEGEYHLHLRTFNAQNNLLSDDQETVSIIAPRSHFGLQIENPYLSLRKGVSRPQLSFKVNAGGPRAVASWDFEISEAFTNKVVFETQGVKELPENLRWNGKNSDKEPVSDGTYICFLSAEDKAGNVLKSDALQVYVETAPPVVDLKVPGHWVDPSKPISLELGLNAADPVGIKSWSLVISNEEQDEPITTLEGEGAAPATLLWNGMDKAGHPVVAGSFLQLTLKALDKAGNEGETAPFSLQVDVKGSGQGGSLALNLTTIYFDAQGSDITDASKKEIETAAASIKPYLKNSQLVVRGYCASAETGDLIALSHERAKNVADWITQKLQLSAGTVYSVGMGDQSPRPDNSAAALPDEKRREVVITVITSTP
jgi:outer membrane protein OmpA-like peptidoglycan-associated protein